MQVAHRPHLPRAVAVSLLAAVLAIVITLVAATRLGDISLSTGATSAASRSAPVAHRRGAPAARPAAIAPTTRAPAWVTNPFVTRLASPVTSPFTVADGS
jgi:hypothetical protein